jgi:hypothetical protein
MSPFYILLSLKKKSPKIPNSDKIPVIPKSLMLNPPHFYACPHKS